MDNLDELGRGEELSLAETLAQEGHGGVEISSCGGLEEVSGGRGRGEEERGGRVKMTDTEVMYTLLNTKFLQRNF